ncbi:MAG TPA: hypothetical protein DCY40_08740 [Actinobacteria bacterium]|nr:hypothetical protein [Actinomycetota bacterium]
MRPRTELRLYGRQGDALRATEPEVLALGVPDRPSGASHLLRVAAVSFACRHAGARVALVGRSSEGLRRTHLEGPSGLPALLTDMQRHGAVNVSDVDARFANGSRIWWTGAFLETEVADLVRQPIDALLVDDLEAMPADLYRRLAERVINAGAAPRRVIAAARELAPWMIERWPPTGAEGRLLVALRSEDLPQDLVDTAAASDLPKTVAERLRLLFPRVYSLPFAPFHEEMLAWSDSIVPGLRPRPFVAVWPREHAKSTIAEGVSVDLGATGRRRYVAYVRESQDQADKSVENIGGLLEAPGLVARFPELAARAVSKYGTSKGWRRNRLRTASGFVVDGLGLDVAARGLRVEEQRPDFIVLDDIDGREDSDKVTARKLRTLRNTILPLGSPGTAVLAVQNLIVPDGVFAQLVDGRADFLVDRLVSGPHKAVEELEYEKREEDTGRVHYVITHGRAAWPERGLAGAQADLNTYGPRGFLEEMQHDLGGREGALLSEDDIRHLPGSIDLDLVVRSGVGVDPSGGGAGGVCGIVGASRLEGRGRASAVVRRDVSQPATKGPQNWADRAIDLYLELEAEAIIAEINFGGDMVKHTIALAAARRDLVVPILIIRATRGKRQRAEPIATLYESGEVLHETQLTQLEREWTRWVPGDKESPNRVDAAVWVLTWLMLGGKRQFKLR